MISWTASSEFSTYRLWEQGRFRRACASAQSRQKLRCSLIQAVNQEEPSDRKPDTWPLWMAGHAQLKFVMTECSKTQIRLSGLSWFCGSHMQSECNGYKLSHQPCKCTFCLSGRSHSCEILPFLPFSIIAHKTSISWMIRGNLVLLQTCMFDSPIWHALWEEHVLSMLQFAYCVTAPA